MAGAIALLALAVGSAGAGPYPAPVASPGRQEPPGQVDVRGVPAGHPAGDEWHEVGTSLPLGAGRTPEYYFRRYHALPPEQLFLPSYYNSYVTRGQRYIPYAGCGGSHPAGGPPPAPDELPVHPYLDSVGSGPVVPLPTFSGRVEARPLKPGHPGLGHEAAPRVRTWSQAPARRSRAVPATNSGARESKPGLMARLWNRVTSNRLGNPR